MKFVCGPLLGGLIKCCIIPVSVSLLFLFYEVSYRKFELRKHVIMSLLTGVINFLIKGQCHRENMQNHCWPTCLQALG